jgi:hypothetical protein
VSTGSIHNTPHCAVVGVPQYTVHCPQDIVRCNIQHSTRQYTGVHSTLSSIHSTRRNELVHRQYSQHSALRGCRSSTEHSTRSTSREQRNVIVHGTVTALQLSPQYTVHCPREQRAHGDERKERSGVLAELRRGAWSVQNYAPK